SYPARRRTPVGRSGCQGLARPMLVVVRPSLADDRGLRRRGYSGILRDMDHDASGSLLTAKSERSFWAFISYSHRDEKAAARLHRDLETYRIPRVLVGRPHEDTVIPKRLFPIFRDRNELASSPDLTGQIRGALERSRSLVVICSPHAAQSRYVNEEVAFFRNIGRSGRVLSIIVSGEPSGSSGEASSGEECFPPAMRSPFLATGSISGTGSAPIASDLRRGKDAPRDALLKVVAGILGVGFDELRRRDQQRRTANRVRAGILLLLSILVVTGSFVALSDADFMLPGSEAVRTWLDDKGITAFRRVAPRAEVDTAAAKARRELLARILWLQLPDGLFSWRLEKTIDGDTWTSAQALAALVSTPELGRDSAHRLMATFDRLFADHLVHDDVGVSGWQFEVGRPPNGAISLWMVSALARALQRRDLFDEEMRNELMRYYGVAVAAADRLHPTSKGGWNMYANQDEAGDHNAYSTVLALQALLDVQAAGLRWGKNGEPPTVLIDSAATWLIDNFGSSGPDAGWTAFPARVLESERDVLDGMTLQIYSTLLRAEAQAKVFLPTPLLQRMTRHLVASGKRSPQYRKDEADFAIRVSGRYEKEGVKFTWYPWAVEASVLWLERGARKGAAAADSQGIRRALGRIVASPDGGFAMEALAKERKTYEASEFLFCLSSVH
ncbi:MAG: TIR domain-containing protein, partial [bacterium]